MASNIISSCCYQGVKHEGQPRGRVETVGETEIYIVEAESDNGIGLVL
jgi:hypothetical protein